MRAADRKLLAKEVALEVVALMAAGRAPVTDADPLMDRAAAAKYLSISVRSFARERIRNPVTLAPAQEHGALSCQWRKSTLDLYKYGNRDPLTAATKKAA
jgi:hypothetical protein